MNEAYDSTEETKKHIDRVGYYLYLMSREILNRSINHDQSKLVPPEKEIFDKYTPKLKETTYGSDEYNEYLKEMKIALKHHYGENRHHPEHFENGVRGMNLIDIMEMLCDWMAASERHEDGCIKTSIEYNQTRFEYSDDLREIFLNTVDCLREMKPEYKDG